MIVFSFDVITGMAEKGLPFALTCSGFVDQDRVLAFLNIVSLYRYGVMK